MQLIHNNIVYNNNDKLFTVNNRALRFGDGLFETIKIVNSEICFLEEHILRLKEGMTALKIDIPEYFNESYFKNKIIDLAKSNNALNLGRARITVYRDSEGLYTPTNNNAGVVIEVSPLNYLSNSEINIGLFSEVKKHYSLFSRFKTLNCNINILAGVFKKENNFDDCLICNEKDNIIEAISSNIFIVKNGAFITPPISDGCVDGIMRKNIINKINEKSYSVLEKSITKEDILSAEEMFLTNVIQGVVLVENYGNKKYENNSIKKLIQ